MSAWSLNLRTKKINGARKSERKIVESTKTKSAGIIVLVFKGGEVAASWCRRQLVMGLKSWGPEKKRRKRKNTRQDKTIAAGPCV